MERRIEKVKSLWKKYTSLFLLVTLLFTSLPIQVRAEESENPSNSEVSEEIEKQQTNQEDTLIENSGEESENNIEEQNTIEESESVEQQSENESSSSNGEEEQRLNYIYIEKPYLQTPETQNVAVSWGDGTEEIDTMTANVNGPFGEEIWTATKKSEEIYLFEKAYDEQAKGIYQMESLNLTIHGEVHTYKLSELGIEAQFGVDEEYEGIEELKPVGKEEDTNVAEIATYSIDESGDVVEQESIGDAIEQAAQDTPAVLSNEENARASSKIVVALDPGHDSKHVGASANDVREEVLTLKIAQYCKEELEKYSGVSVYMTRTTADCPYPGGSSSYDISKRVEAAANAGADIYVSIHLNSATSTSANGAEVIYPNSSWKPQVGADGKKMAESIEKELVGIGLNERSIYSKNTTVGETYPDGSVSDYYTVQISAKEHGIPGIIVEHAFVTNKSDVNNYLNNEAGLKKLGVADATGIAKYYGLTKGANWEQDSKGWRYKSGSGYLKNTWYQIDGSWYRFGEDGYMKTGFQKINGYTYYLGTSSDGAMKTGWQKIDNAWYYFGSANDGVMRTGWQHMGSSWYYFGDANDGVMKTGWCKVATTWYYFGSTNDGIMKTGWQYIGSDWYYFGSSNQGGMRTGWQRLGSNWYYFGDSNGGAMRSGLTKVGKYWYYLGEAGSGSMLTGWWMIKDKKYYFGPANDGVMRTGWQQFGSNWYYFGDADDGSMKTGWCQIASTWYYFGNSNDGVMKTGWQYIGSDWYYFGNANEGGMRTGWQEIAGVWYYFRSGGAYDASMGHTPKNTNVPEGTYLIEGKTEVTVNQMVNYFKQSKKTYPKDALGKGGASTIEQFCQIYYEEAEKENIKAEVAFAQSMKETGWLRFGGSVKIGQYNFAGLGSTTVGVTGETFHNVREGVRAQIQHLKAYGSTQSLNQKCVDTRFQYVTRGSSIYVEWLGIPNNPYGKGWAADDGYGVEIVKMIKNMKKM